MSVPSIFPARVWLQVLGAFLILALASCQDGPSPTEPSLVGPSMAVVVEDPQNADLPLVNSLEDPGDGTCDVSTTGDGCTLRDAIAFANAGAEIRFADWLTTGGPETITLGGTQLTIDKNLTITGPGASNLSVSGNSSSRVFYVAPDVTASISGLTISGGIVGSNLNDDYEGGAGILNEGSLTLAQCVVTQNSANDNKPGGGIENNGGNLTISECEISENAAEDNGGGIYAQISMWTDASMKVTINSSTISGNSSGAWGGGIANEQGSTLTITESIVSENQATVGGGIANSDGSATVNETAITDNEADEGGGIFQATGAASGGIIEVVSSTISGNKAYDGGGIGAYISFSTTELVQHTVVRNSTISGNTATNRGGGFFNQDGKATIVLTTITGNQADVKGGGLYNRGDPNSPMLTEVKGSLVWGNTSVTSTPDDLDAESTSADFNSLGYNLVGAAGANVDLAGTFNGTGDQIGITSAGLGTLADNGGATKTHALLSGSSAIDAGTCYDAANEIVGSDQRGEARPQGIGCDIGAYESDEASGLLDPGFSFDLTSLPDKTYGDDPFDVSGSYATSSAESTGTVYFGKAPGSVGCSVTSDGTVTLTGAAIGGDLCKLTAYIASDGTYSSAGPIEQSFAIGQAALLVTANDETITFGQTPSFGLSYEGFLGSDDASSLSGTLVYEFAGIGQTSYGPSTTTPANAGTYSITPSGLDAYDYAITYGDPGTFTINKAPGSVSIDNIPTEPRGGDSFTPTYDQAGDGTASVESSTLSVCTVSAGVVTFADDGGTCTLVASVAEGTNHLAATGVSQSFTVAPGILPPEEAIPELIAASEDAGLSKGNVNKLRDALKHWEAGRITATLSNLDAYINDVESQIGKKVTPEDAEELIAAAQEIIDTILAGTGS